MQRLFLACLLLCAPTIVWAGPTSQPLAEYKTTATAIRSNLSPSLAANNNAQPPYLGIAISRGASSGIVIEHVADGSPAQTAGLRQGDQLIRIDGRPLTADVFEDTLHQYEPGDDLTLTLRRAGSEVNASVTLGTPSHPLHASERRVSWGVNVRDGADGSGANVFSVATDSPGAKAGIRAGDVLLELDGVAVSSAAVVLDILQSHSPEETIAAKVQRAGKAMAVNITLAGETTRAALERALDPFRFVRQNIWTRPVYRIAIIGIEYPDVKHNEKITTGDWEEQFFSIASYENKNNATGQPVYGSLNDFYLEQSYGKFHLDGRMFDWVAVSKPRADYGRGTGDNANLLPEALDKLMEREGKDCLKDFDGLFFVHAGSRVQTTRGGLYWPHKAYTTHKGKRWPFVIIPEGGATMSNISLCAHEFGHMLGLPDQYARPENPGSEGLGVWCLMSNQLSAGKPQHMSAWCKEQLGWIHPAIIDPRVKQKLLLSPIEESPDECYKVLLRDDGSEYFLLENRKKEKFDQDLPAGGLLIWRITQGHVTLEESHGVEGPAGPRTFLLSVPFPSSSNNSFTPYTTPNSRSTLGGGHNVFITDIQKLDDGRIAFSIGYEVL